jgi:hypothetical protein
VRDKKSGAQDSGHARPGWQVAHPTTTVARRRRRTVQASSVMKISRCRHARRFHGLARHPPLPRRDEMNRRSPPLLRSPPLSRLYLSSFPPSRFPPRRSDLDGGVPQLIGLYAPVVENGQAPYR